MFTFFRRTKPARRTRLLRATSWKPRLEVLEDRFLLSTFTPISLGSAATRSLSTIDPTFPTGNLTLLGVPFVIHYRKQRCME